MTNPQPDTLEDGPIGMFHAFRYRNYRLLWIGDLCTAGAQWVQQVTVTWVVYVLTGSGGITGSINLMRAVATLIFSAPAGTTVDRMSRNRVIAVSQFSMFLLTFLIALDIQFKTIEVWHLFVFMFLISAAQVFNMIARQTFVFELIPRRVIPNAVALSWLAFSFARSLGTAAGGQLLNMVGPALNFFIQGGAYLIVMTTVLMIHTEARPAPVTAAARPSFLTSMRTGYRYAVGDPQLRLLVLMSGISPLLIIPLHAALLPIFAAKTFHSGAATFGILAGSLGLGGFFGSLLTASLNHIDRRGLMQMIALFIMAGSETTFSVLAGVTGNLWLAIPFLVIAGAAESIYTTTNTSVLQLLAPDHMRGSITSVIQITMLLMPIGSALAGAAADRLGAPLVGATITFAALLVDLSILVLSSRMRNLRLSELVREQETPITAAH